MLHNQSNERKSVAQDETVAEQSGAPAQGLPIDASLVNRILDVIQNFPPERRASAALRLLSFINLHEGLLGRSGAQLVDIVLTFTHMVLDDIKRRTGKCRFETLASVTGGAASAVGIVLREESRERQHAYIGAVARLLMIGGVIKNADFGTGELELAPLIHPALETNRALLLDSKVLQNMIAEIEQITSKPLPEHLVASRRTVMEDVFDPQYL